MTAAETSRVTLEEVLRVGAQLYKRVEEYAWQWAVESGKDPTDFNVLQEQRELAIQLVLWERRPMGANPDFVTHPFVKGSYQKSMQVLETLWNLFPEDWIKRSAQDPFKVTSGKEGNGVYYHRRKRNDVYIDSFARLSFGGRTLKEQRQTAAHELCHRFEDVVPGIPELEKEFHEYRTGDSRSVCYGPRAHKRVSKGGFLNKYMGVFYSWGFYELLSCGLEMYVLGRFRYDFRKDPEYAAFVLGILALV